MVQLALRSALSDRASEERVVVVDEWPFDRAEDGGRPRRSSALGLDGSILIVLDRYGTTTPTGRSATSPRAAILSGELNAYDILCNDWVVFARYNVPGTGTEVVESEATAGRTGQGAIVEPEAVATVDEARAGRRGRGLDDRTTTTVEATDSPEADDGDAEETPT